MFFSIELTESVEVAVPWASHEAGDGPVEVAAPWASHEVGDGRLPASREVVGMFKALPWRVLRTGVN